MARRWPRQLKAQQHGCDLGRILVTIDDLKLLRQELQEDEVINNHLRFIVLPDRLKDFDDLRSLPNPDELEVRIESTEFVLTLGYDSARVQGDPYATAVVEHWARPLRTSKLSPRAWKQASKKGALLLAISGFAAWTYVKAVTNPGVWTIIGAALGTISMAASMLTLAFYISGKLRSHTIFYPGSREEFRKSDVDTRRHRRQLGVAVAAARLAATVAITVALLTKN
jgi:hypothetical protein